MIPTILVNDSTLSSSSATDLVSGVVDFVSTMLHQAAYTRDELPRNAMLAYHVDYYLAQVANGGHKQFIHNSHWMKAVIEDITAGLAAMEAAPYEGIFAELRRVVDGEGNTTGSESLAKAAPALEALDKRFLEHDTYKTFSPIIARWLRTLPELQGIPDERYVPELQRLSNTNPNRAIRLAEREEARRRANERNPIWVAARLLCEKANCLPFQGLRAGLPAEVSPDGRQGGWSIFTGDDIKMVFLFNDIAYLCDTYLADGSRMTATHSHPDQRAVDAALPSGASMIDRMKAFQRKENREIARIPAELVSAAVQTVIARQEENQPSNG